MMRHSAYGWMLMLVLLCGCRREPVPAGEESTPILFTAEMAHVSSSVTKSYPNESDYLIADQNKIGVYATWISPENKSTDVFSKIPVTCKQDSVDPTKFTWEYSPLQYWRKGGQYQFSAIYPFNVNVQYGTSGNKQVITYSMHVDNYDLMVASATRNLTLEDDTSPVVLQFRHATAAVRFLFCKGSDTNNYLLTNFEVQNLQAVGILVYDGGEVQLQDWNLAEFRSPTVMEWEAENLPEGGIQIPTDYTDLADDSKKWVDWHFVLPQDLIHDDGYHPQVRFAVNVNSDNTPVYTTLSLPETYSNGNHVVWEPGKMYTYYIQIQPSTASITVKVTDWESYYLAVDDMTF